MAEPRDGWSKLDVFGKLVGSVLIPVALFWAGNEISQEQRQSSERRLDQERLAADSQRVVERTMLLIESITSGDTLKRNVALAVANHLADRDQLPKELFPAILQIVRGAQPTTGRTEAEPSQTTQLATRALASAGPGYALAPGADTTWVYYGSYDLDNNRQVTRNLSGSARIDSGAVLTADTDIFQRARQPQYRGDAWRMGQVVGVLSEGRKVKVAEVDTIPGVGNTALLWLKVVPR